MLAGRLADVGLALRGEASLAALTEDVVKTSAIEGESLNVASVRSSIARRLGSTSARWRRSIVTSRAWSTWCWTRPPAAAPVTDARLFGWHAALFPTGYSGMSRITVGGWRTDATGPMQVVSGPIGRQRVHFEAPPAAPSPARSRAFSRGSMPSRSKPC